MKMKTAARTVSSLMVALLASMLCAFGLFAMAGCSAEETADTAVQEVLGGSEDLRMRAITNLRTTKTTARATTTMPTIPMTTTKTMAMTETMADWIATTSHRTEKPSCRACLDTCLDIGRSSQGGICINMENTSSRYFYTPYSLFIVRV